MEFNVIKRRESLRHFKLASLEKFRQSPLEGQRKYIFNVIDLKLRIDSVAARARR